MSSPNSFEKEPAYSPSLSAVRVSLLYTAEKVQAAPINILSTINSSRVVTIQLDRAFSHSFAFMTRQLFAVEQLLKRTVLPVQHHTAHGQREGPQWNISRLKSRIVFSGNQSYKRKYWTYILLCITDHINRTSNVAAGCIAVVLYRAGEQRGGFN